MAEHLFRFGEKKGSGWGRHRLKPSGCRTVYFDAFESRRTQYIGLEDVCAGAAAGGMTALSSVCLVSTATPTPTPTFTPTAPPNVFHISCDLTENDGFANIRNFPASNFVTDSTSNGQIVMTLFKGTVLSVYETRLARDGVAWARISGYEAYNGNTLWIRTMRTNNQPLIVAGAPTACAQLTPHPAPTQQPTQAPVFLPIAAGCVSGSVCPHQTWNPSTQQQLIVAFVLACEAGNDREDQTRADALGNAYVIRNRMKSLPYNGTADQVVRQLGQFQCWSDGAPFSSQINMNPPDYNIDPVVLNYANALISGNLPQYGLPFNGSIRYVGLYTYGLFSQIGNNIEATPNAVVAALSPYCSTLDLGNIYIGLAPYGVRLTASAFFSDDPQCSF